MENFTKPTVLKSVDYTTTNNTDLTPSEIELLKAENESLKFENEKCNNIISNGSIDMKAYMNFCKLLTSATTLSYEYAGTITELQSELQAYKNKLADGRMVELPCKVGDTVYGIIVDRLQDMKKSANEQPIPFLRIADGIAESFLIRKDRVNIYFQTKSRGLPMCYSCDFNKTVFLTEPEALLKLGEGENNEINR